MFAYVARQAIYNKAKQVFGYELLFRDGIKNCFPDVDPDEATSSMLAGSHLSVGVETITHNKVAFINFHTDTIINRFPSTLDPLNVVIEIIETVEVTPELIEACKQIKKQGYRIALDDYDFSPNWERLMQYVDYIKFEVQMIDLQNAKQQAILKKFKERGITLVVERVETHEEFELFNAAGFDFFQGYFLSKPEMVKHKNIDVSMTSIIELLSISASADFDARKVVDIFEKDVGLTFKLMRFINNPTVNKKNNIESVTHAINFLGQNEMKKFIALLALANLKGNKPEDLLVSSLTRARFCRQLSAKIGVAEDPPNGFMLGLFSRIDALLDT
ncbi:EAL and HDOD domain-containing protein, partial [Glaciecola petra]